MENKKTCLVIGGSGGMGSQICRVLANSGFAVAIGYKDSKVKADILRNEIEKNGGNAYGVSVDVSKEKSVVKAVDVISDIFKSKVLYLVYTPGIEFVYRQFSDLTWPQIKRQIDVLLAGGWYSLKALLPYMEEEKFGRIVFINSSVSWGMPPPSLADYVIGRYAQIGLVKSAAVELGPKGITVNSVSPGLTEADSISSVPEIVKRMYTSMNPSRRLAKVEDIASVVLFLLQKESSYLNGVDIPVSGGTLMR